MTSILHIKAAHRSGGLLSTFVCTVTLGLPYGVSCQQVKPATKFAMHPITRDSALPPWSPRFLFDVACIMFLPGPITEPKSGTGFMFEAATGAIAHACIFLQRAYGEESCWIEWDFKNRTMTFEPNVTTTGPCPCEDVDM